jgi:hypothetical protein
MKITITALILASSLGACSVTKELVITDFKPDKEHTTKAQKDHKDKHHTQRYVAKVSDGSGAKPKPAQVEIYDIGTHVDSEGNLVTAHKVMRIVVSPHWEVVPQVKADNLIANKPAPHAPHEPSKEDLRKAIEDAREAATAVRNEMKRFEASRPAPQQTTQQPQIDNNAGSEVDSAAVIRQGFSRASSQPAEEALQNYGQSDPRKP